MDFDDTLVLNQAHFEEALDGLAALVRRRLGLGPAEVRAAFGRVDARLGAHGRHRNRFLLSVLLTYCELAKASAVPAELLADLAGLAAHPYDALPEPCPGVTLALGELRAAHRGPLWLLTTGDAVVQHGRVRRSGLAEHFDAIHVVPEKTAAVYRELGSGHRNRWMVGNAPRTDILPALEAGFRVLHVAVPTWELDQAPLPAQVPQVGGFPAAVRHLLEQVRG